MTITFPHDPPTTPAPQRAKYQLLSLTGVADDNLALTQQVQSHQGERWSVEFPLPPILERATAEAWIAWRAALRGRYGYFRLTVDPTARTPMGAVSGSPVANSAMSPAVNTARSRLLYVRSLGAGVTDVFKAGDWISVSVNSLPRLHKVLQTVSSDGSGNAVLDIAPALRGDIADGAAITYQNCQGTFRLSDDVADWTVDRLKDYGMTLRAMEMLP